MATRSMFFNTSSVWCLLLSLVVASAIFVQVDSKKPIVVQYFTNWGIYARNFQAWDVDFKSITHLNYAFFDVTSSCEVKSLDAWSDFDKRYANLGMTWYPEFNGLTGNLGAFKILKEKLRSLQSDFKLMLTLGGWTKSVWFSKCAKNETLRSKLISSAVETCLQYEFNGIDIDWEYPGGGGQTGNTEDPSDTSNYLKLLKGLRTALDAASNGVHYDLSIAQGMNPAVLEQPDVAATCDVVDFVNLMTYDFAGGWNKFTGMNSPVYPDPEDQLNDPKFNIDSGVQKLIALGCPPSKMVLGMPAYGRNWAGVEEGGVNGLYQVSSLGAAAGTWEKGALSFHDIVKNRTPAQGYQEFWREETKTPYLYNAAKKEFVTFDNERSIEFKTSYAKNAGLAGFMFWEASDDYREGNTDVSGGGESMNIANYRLLNAAHQGWEQSPAIEPPTTEQPTEENPTEQPTVEQPTVEQPTVEEPTPTVEEPTVEEATEPTVEGPSEGNTSPPVVPPSGSKIECGKAVAVDAGVSDVWCSDRCLWTQLTLKMLKTCSGTEASCLGEAFKENHFDSFCDISQVVVGVRRLRGSH